MYKCNEQRTIVRGVQVYKEAGKYYIQSKSAFQGVVVLSKSQALRIHWELGKLVGKIDWRSEYIKEKNKMIRKNETKKEREVRMGTRLVVGKFASIKK